MRHADDPPAERGVIARVGVRHATHVFFFRKRKLFRRFAQLRLAPLLDLREQLDAQRK